MPSVNEEVVHGIPGKRTLKEGDIVSIDVGIEYEGYFADSAMTYPVGNIPRLLKKLLSVSKKALYRGIKKSIEGNFLGDISFAIQNFVENAGFSVIRDFVGHGIGRSLHQEPQIPNFGRPRRGIVLREGMGLALEPMVSLGKWHIRILDDGWTAVTIDGSPTSHFEHTIVVGRRKALIIT